MEKKNNPGLLLGALDNVEVVLEMLLPNSGFPKVFPSTNSGIWAKIRYAHVIELWVWPALNRPSVEPTNLCFFQTNTSNLGKNCSQGTSFRKRSSSQSWEHLGKRWESNCFFNLILGVAFPLWYMTVPKIKNLDDWCSKYIWGFQVGQSCNQAALFLSQRCQSSTKCAMSSLRS